MRESHFVQKKINSNNALGTATKYDSKIRTTKNGDITHATAEFAATRFMVNKVIQNRH